MAITLPHTFEDGPGHTASGVQVMDNLNALKAAIEGVGESQVQTDAFQAGVLASTDWNPSGFSINSGTAGLTSEAATGGGAWLPAPVAGLVRTSTPSAVVGPLVPPVKPGSGGWMCIGVEITASGSGATVSLVSGAEKGTEAEAIAAPPPTTSGALRIRDIPIHNTAGVYSKGTGRDRRPWARGAFAYIVRTSGDISLGTLPANLDTANLALRIECSGVPLELSLVGALVLGSEAANARLGFNVTGAEELTSGYPVAGELAPNFNLNYLYVPAAGSIVFRPRGWQSGGSTATVKGLSPPLLFTVREVRTPNANNGTA